MFHIGLYIFNMSIKEWRQPYQYTHFEHKSIDIGIDQRKPHHRTSCYLHMTDDWIQAYQTMHTIGNSENAAMILAVSISYAIWAWRSQDNLAVFDFQT